MDNSCVKHCVCVHTEPAYLLSLPAVKGTDKGQPCMTKNLLRIVISVAPSFCSAEPGSLDEAAGPRSLKTELAELGGGNISRYVSQAP